MPGLAIMALKSTPAIVTRHAIDLDAGGKLWVSFKLEWAGCDVQNGTNVAAGTNFNIKFTAIDSSM